MSNIYDEIISQKNNGHPLVCVTVTAKEGHGPCAVGAKMLVLNNDSTVGTVGGGSVEKIAIIKLFLTAPCQFKLVKNSRYHLVV